MKFAFALFVPTLACACGTEHAGGGGDQTRGSHRRAETPRPGFHGANPNGDS